jgi:hypothetical protein
MVDVVPSRGDWELPAGRTSPPTPSGLVRIRSRRTGSRSEISGGFGCRFEARNRPATRRAVVRAGGDRFTAMLAVRGHSQCPLATES